MELQVLIDGVDLTHLVQLRETRISFELTNYISVAELALKDGVGVNAECEFAELAEVQLIDPDTTEKLFGGSVVSIDQIWRGPGRRLLKVACQDWMAQLDQVTVTQTWTGATDRAIIQELIGDWFPSFTALTANVGQYIAIDYEAKDESVRSVIQKICAMASAECRVDPDKNVYYFRPSETTNPAPFGLSTEPNGTTTFPYDRGVTYKKHFPQPANQITFIGGIYPLNGEEIVEEVEDLDSQAEYGVRAITIVDREVIDPVIAGLRANAELERRAWPEESGNLVQHKDGLEIGQTIYIKSSEFGFEGQYVIRRLTLSWRTKSKLNYQIEFGDYRPDLVRLLQLLNDRTTEGSILGITVSVPAEGSVTEAMLADGAVTEAKIAIGAVTNSVIALGTILSTNIADNAVTTPKLNANAVTANKIGAGEVIAGKLAASAVIAGNIAAGSITAAHTVFATSAIVSADIASAQITTAKIANLAVGNAQLDNLSITTGKIQDAQITTAKIGDLQVTGAKIASATIGSAQIANAAIGSTQIADASITTAKIANLAVQNAKIGDLEVSTLKIQGDAITTAKIVNRAVDGFKLALLSISDVHIQDASIVSAKIANLAVVTARIADLNVSTIKIAGLAIDTNKLAALSVATGNIQGSAVGTSQIANGSVDGFKIQTLAISDVHIQSGSITNAKIANLAVDNAKISNMAVTKLQTGTLTVSGTSAGIEVAYSFDSRKARVFPGEISIVDPGNAVVFSASGSTFLVSNNAVFNGYVSAAVGFRSNGIAVIDGSQNCQFVNCTVTGALRLGGAIISGSPALPATHKIPVYNSAGVFLNYMFLWP